MNIPLVSIIIPTCNRNWWLENISIPSVLTQIYPKERIEIIVIDDGEEDAKIALDKFGENIKYFKTKTPFSGPSAARNIGIKEAKGKYINFLDSDDVLLRNHIGTLVYVLEQYEYKVVYTDAYRIHYTKNGIGYNRIDGTEIPHSHNFSIDLLKSQNITPNLCVMYERSESPLLFDEELRSHEDWEFWVRLYKKYSDFKHISEVTCEVSWNTDGSTLTSNPSGEFKQHCGYAIQKIRRLL